MLLLVFSLWLLVKVVLILLVLFKLLSAMRKRVDKITECGYIPEDPKPRFRRFVTRLARIAVWWQAKSVTVRGRENLNAASPMIIAPNHTHYLDPLVWPTILDDVPHPRYLVDASVFRFFGGIAAYFLSAGGAIPVDRTPGKGTEARLSGVKSLATGRKLIIFPEGFAYLDGSTNEFKKGTVRIAKATAKETGQETYITPVYMLYGKYPGAWLKKYSNPIQFAIVFLLAPYYRAGLEIVIGKPIPISQFPDDDAEATEFLRNAVLALKPVKAPV